MLPIPDDMKFSILSKLPAKSLCRFKCVSKSVLGLITSDIFVKTHLSQSQPQIVFYGQNPYYVHYSEDNIHKVELEDVVIPSQLKQQLSPYRNSVRLIGSCNGLLCFIFDSESSKEEGFVYNPSTREYKFIASDNMPHNSARVVMSHGFGYVESTEDYLLVKITCLNWNMEFLNIFSLRNDTWETIKYDQALGTYVYITGTGIYLKGCIYWLFNCSGRDKVVALDLEEKKFRILYSTTLEPVVTRSTYWVSVMEDSICLLKDDRGKVDKFWVMKEPLDGEECWSKILVPSRFETCAFLWKNSEQAIALAHDSHDSGELVLLFGSKDKQDGACTDIKLEAWPGVLDARLFYNMLCLYEESLVSPN